MLLNAGVSLAAVTKRFKLTPWLETKAITTQAQSIKVQKTFVQRRAGQGAGFSTHGPRGGLRRRGRCAPSLVARYPCGLVAAAVAAGPDRTGHDAVQ